MVRGNFITFEGRSLCAKHALQYVKGARYGYLRYLPVVRLTSSLVEQLNEGPS